MPFFARPNLDDTQFKQLTGSTLNLSGVTHITTSSGLTLSSGIGDIVVTAKDAQFSADGYVLTYDYSRQEINLQPSSGSGGTQSYCGKSPSTCTVGGLNAGSTLTGKTLSCILEEILVPALQPAITSFSRTFTLLCSPSTSTGYYEVLSNVTLSGYSTFNQGTVSPVYCAGASTVVGTPNNYCYTGYFSCASPSTALSNSVYLGVFPVQNSASAFNGRVDYNAGTLVKNSVGGASTAVSPNPQLAGSTAFLSQNINGVYPYFWGKSPTLPVAGQSLINAACTAGHVCISTSASDTPVTNYNAVGEYIWFAIPGTSASKTKWQGSNSPSNCGTIPGLLFASEASVSVSSPTMGLWTSVPYKFYISNYATSVNYIMTFKNS